MYRSKCQSLFLVICLGAPDAILSFQPAPAGSFGVSPSARTVCSSTRAASPPLFAANKGGDEGMSAAGKERRDEDKRRKNRKSDVIIGKTSAKAGAKDFALNPQSTELEWVKHASAMEQQISRNTELGLDMLKMLRLEESVEAFDKVFLLKPNAYCWQAGIAKYYLGDLLGAAKIFAQSAAIYESKFGQLASEERIWRDACELKYLSALNRKQKEAMKGKGGIKEVMSQLAEPDPESDIPIEFRRVIRITKEMFEASTKEDSVNLALSRAKLRSICGTFDTKPTLDRKMWKLNSWYYLGLHYDAIGEEEESKECIKMALRLCPTSKGDDIVHTLPLLHMSKRDWFDDDEYEESDGSAAEVQTKSSGSLIKLPLGVTADPVIAKSLQDSISKMKFQELKTALKNRGLPHTGAKDELQSRLFNSLVDDVGFS